MKTTSGERYIRFGSFVAIACLAAPIAGAGAISVKSGHAPIVRPHAVGADANGQPRADGRDEERRTALLDPSSRYAMNRTLFTPEDEGRRFVDAPRVRAADERPGEEMGLDLPEPGPLSAIIATIALAAFILIRRAF